jgi:hypothetical protein
VWAERTGRRQAADHGRGLLRFAFYGRVSTEDRQDPVMSLARQREQAVALVAVSARQESEKGGQTSSGSSRHGQGQPRVTMSHAQIQPIVGFSRVRGGIAPKSQCALTGVFAVEGPVMSGSTDR